MTIDISKLTDQEQEELVEKILRAKVEHQTELPARLAQEALREIQESGLEPDDDELDMLLGGKYKNAAEFRQSIKEYIRENLGEPKVDISKINSSRELYDIAWKPTQERAERLAREYQEAHRPTRTIDQVEDRHELGVMAYESVKKQSAKRDDNDHNPIANINDTETLYDMALRQAIKTRKGKNTSES